MSGTNKAKARFRLAIRSSLERLVKAGEPISKQAVIDNALLEGGRPVGKSTLYSRHEVTGALVHADLHSEIEAAIEQGRKRSGRKSRAETISHLRREMSELKRENTRLVDQVVEQEAKLLDADARVHGERHVIIAQETEIYVLAKVADSLAMSTISEFRQVVQRYEKKYAADQRLKLASLEAGRYLDEVRLSKFVALEGRKRSAGSE